MKYICSVALILALTLPATAEARRPVQLPVSQGKRWIEQLYQGVAEAQPLGYDYRFRVGPCGKVSRWKVACEVRSTRKPPGEACESLVGVTVGARYSRRRHGYEPYVADKRTLYDECRLTTG
jgi:hypothetical protein